MEQRLFCKRVCPCGLCSASLSSEMEPIHLDSQIRAGLERRCLSFPRTQQQELVPYLHLLKVGIRQSAGVRKTTKTAPSHREPPFSGVALIDARPRTLPSHPIVPVDRLLSKASGQHRSQASSFQNSF